jgi:hypothetical protein
MVVRQQVGRLKEPYDDVHRPSRMAVEVYARHADLKSFPENAIVLAWNRRQTCVRRRSLEGGFKPDSGRGDAVYALQLPESTRCPTVRNDADKPPCEGGIDPTGWHPDTSSDRLSRLLSRHQWCGRGHDSNTPILVRLKAAAKPGEHDYGLHLRLRARRYSHPLVGLGLAGGGSQPR